MKNHHPDELLTLYDKLISPLPGIERKGASMPYTSLNGNMFSFLDKEGLLSIRLSKEDRNTFLETYPDSLPVQHGVVMKEYVQVPEKLFGNPAELQTWMERSYGYMITLKPKPGKR